jgi:hypothetical protein
VADGVGEGVKPEAAVKVCGTEQVRVVRGQPREERWPPQAEATFRVEGPDDRDQLKVRRAEAGELEVDQRADVAAMDEDVAQVEVSVQQNLAVCRGPAASRRRTARTAPRTRSPAGSRRPAAADAGLYGSSGSMAMTSW